MTKVFIVAKRMKLKGEYLCIDCSAQREGAIRLMDIDSWLYQMGSTINTLSKLGEVRYQVSFSNTPRFEQMLELMKASGVKFTSKKKEERVRLATGEGIVINEFILKKSKR